MNNVEEKRGDLIKPSARKSIHSHRFCPFLPSEYKDTMGRFGINKPNRSKDLNTSQDEGRDVVDNVMSKFAFPGDESNKQPSKYIRERSISVDNDIHNLYQKEYSNVLSTSLPTNLPSHSHYSDDSSESQDEGQTSNNSGLVNRRTSRGNISFEESFIHPFPERESEVFDSRFNQREEKNGTTTSSGMSIWPFLIVILTVPAIAYKTLKVNNLVYDKNNFYDDIENLSKKYNVNHESIEKVQIGISSILQNEDADSFVFVYNSGSPSYDPEAFDKFMDDIAYYSAKYLRNDSTPVQYTVVDGATLRLRNSEELIHKYREDVTKTGVMLVRGIDAVPSNLAMAFHYYCDEYNPVAKKSAIFSTIDLARCSQEKSSTHATLEKCLKNKWQSVSMDNMGPLLTRVVSVVVDVTN